MTRSLAVALCLALTATACAGGRSATTPATIRLKAFLAAPDARRLERLQPDLARAHDDERSRGEARALLRSAFESRWIEGHRTPLTLGQFDGIAGGVGGVFGDEGEALVDALARRLPAEWRDREFVAWSRAHLPAQAGGQPTVDRLLAAAPPALAKALPHLALALELAPDAQVGQVRAELEKRLDGTPAAGMGAVFQRLEELDRTDALTRWRESRAGTGGRARLGDGLFALPAPSWTDAGESLAPLVKASSHAPVAWIAKAAEAVRAGQRDGMGGLLVTLCKLASPGAAHDALAPATDPDSFRWYHGEVLPPLHADHALLTRDYDALKRFADAGRAADLFDVTGAHYYAFAKLKEAVFTDLVRPWAKGDLRARVYEVALAGNWSAPHRALLALDLITEQTGAGLTPGWPGARPRIAVAAALFVGQVEHDTTPAQLDALVQGPLLDALVAEALVLLRAGDASAKLTIELLNELAARLAVMRRRGAHTRDSKPLKRLYDAMVEQVLETLGKLPQPGAGAFDATAQTSIGRFIDALTFAFRLAPVVEAARGEKGDWFGQAIDGLAGRVFGLPKEGLPDVTYWPAERTRFLARLLVALDPPLRSCLETMGTPAQRGRLFRAVHLPLVRVHGFLRTLREISNDAWPHLAWARADHELYAALFAALDTRRWVDADEAMVELAQDHLSRVHHASVWAANVREVFDGRGGANLHAGVLARLLRVSLQSDAPLIWPLADLLLDRLERQPEVVGPRFPLDGPPGDRDTLAGPWPLAPLALNLVTAAEWRLYPFTLASGGQLDWSRLVRFESGALPFSFHLEQTVASRRVDGTRRARLAHLLSEKLDAAGAPASAARLELLGQVVALLPNAPDNIEGATAPLAGYRAQKQWVYQRIAGSLGETQAPEDRARLLRVAMTVEAGVRTGGALEPAFEQVAETYLSHAPDADRERMRVEDVLAERAELVRQGAGPPRDLTAGRRAAIDAALAAYGKPAPCAPDAGLRHRGYQRRLESLQPERVLSVLRLRAHLKGLLDSSESASNADLERCGALLELIDQSCFFSRPDFDVEQVALYARPLARDGSGTWRPALVVLAWCDTALRRVILRHAELAARRDKAGAALAACLRQKLLRLNEAVFHTVRGIAEGAAGAPGPVFDDFRPHRLRHALLDFRVLAEQVLEEEASAESLSRDAFAGARMNLEDAAGAPPSDRALMTRLFGIGRALSFDVLVRFAATCANDRSLPAALSSGAASFLNEPHDGLLAGAGTAMGVLDALERLAEACALAGAPAEYRRFFAERLTHRADGETRLADQVGLALEAPFYRGAEPAQRAELARVIDRWRAWLAKPEAASRGPLTAALAADLGRWIDQLLRGIGRPAGAPSIWEPAARLEAEPGLRADPPRAFFGLVAWWLSLARAADPAAVRALFEPRAPPAVPDSCYDQLRECYRRRCETELRHLAKDLDERARALARPPAEGWAAWPRALWDQGAPARASWRALLDAPRRYSRWAAEAPLPEPFRVPDGQRERALAGKRWEGLRAVLVPADQDGPRLGWDEPAGDSSAFVAAGGWAAEWLIALRWHAAPPADARGSDTAWATREAASDAVRAWLAVPAAPLTFYHGDYVYHPLARPALPDGLPFRARMAVARLCTQVAPLVPVPSLAGEAAVAPPDLASAVRAKEELLQALLDLAVRERDAGAAGWFEAGARWFPYLTACAVRQRPDGTLYAAQPHDERRAFPGDWLQELHGAAPDLYPAAARAVLAAPLARIAAAGVIEGQAAGYSSGVPHNGAAASAGVTRSSVPVAPERAPAPAGAPVDAGDSQLAPANAWRAIAAWAADAIVQAAGGAPVVPPEVAYAHGGWRIALGAGELADTLARRDARTPVNRRAAVRLAGVTPHDALTIAVDVDGREVARRTFTVVGPWPIWFAVHTGTSDPWVLAVAVLCLALLAWRLVTRLRHARDAWDRAGLAASLLALAAVWLAWPAPAPRAVGELGGTVELWVPSDAAVPERLRALAPLTCAHVYRALCRETGDELPGADPDLTDRYLLLAGQLASPWPPWPARAHEAGPGALAEMQFRLSAFAHGRLEVADGRVDAANLASFRQAAASIAYRGEPELPPALTGRFDGGAALAVVVSSGDHGALAAPRVARSRPAAPTVTLCPYGPSRDAGDRQLRARERIAWLDAHSTALLALGPDGALDASVALRADALDAADRAALVPQDMDRCREAWWAGLSDAELSAASRRFAERAVLEFRRGRRANSRTVLAVEPSAARTLLLFLAALLTALLPAWLCKVGLARPADAVLALAQALAGPLVLAALLPALALAEPARTFGAGLDEALRVALWWTLAGIAAGGLVSLAFALAARSSPFTRAVLGDKATWPTRRRAHARAAIARAFGAFALAIGLAFMLAVPAWGSDLGASLCAALAFWMVGITLSWTLPPPASRGTMRG